jgi:hypothetical protein
MAEANLTQTADMIRGNYILQMILNNGRIMLYTLDMDKPLIRPAPSAALSGWKLPGTATPPLLSPMARARGETIEPVPHHITMSPLAKELVVGEQEAKIVRKLVMRYLSSQTPQANAPEAPDEYVAWLRAYILDTGDWKEDEMMFHHGLELVAGEPRQVGTYVLNGDLYQIRFRVVNVNGRLHYNTYTYPMVFHTLPVHRVKLGEEMSMIVTHAVIDLLAASSRPHLRDTSRNIRLTNLLFFTEGLFRLANITMPW